MLIAFVDIALTITFVLLHILVLCAVDQIIIFGLLMLSRLPIPL